MALGIKYAKHEIIKAVMKEFIARGLDEVYAVEIEVWKKYMREKKFAIKLDKQMRGEIERFRGTIMSWTPKELEEVVIKGLNCLEKDMQ